VLDSIVGVVGSVKGKDTGWGYGMKQGGSVMNVQVEADSKISRCNGEVMARLGRVRLWVKLSMGMLV